MHRHAATLGLLVLVLAFPYWVYVPCILAAMVFIPFYAEAIPLGFLIDTLYGPGSHGGFSLLFPFALGAVFCTIVLLPIREFLRLKDA